MDADAQIQVGDSVLQHGPRNDRVYLMHWGGGAAGPVLDMMERLAKKHGYGKLFAKIPAAQREAFVAAGFTCDICVPRFYGGREDGFFAEKYVDPARREDPARADIEAILAACRQDAYSGEVDLPAGMRMKRAGVDDLPELADLYREVFPSYPFPVQDPDYLRSTLDHVFYLLAYEHATLAGASSCEMDRDWQNAEMTDFAVRPFFRGRRLAVALLAQMEPMARAEGILMAYTIARARSGGMNLTFRRAGYTYAGTLWRNTDISGGIESMNVWWRELAVTATPRTLPR